MIRYFRDRKRARIKETPTPPDWPERLPRVAPYYARLTGPLREELHLHMRVFLAEKSFEGCGGFVLEEDARLRIAAYACLLLLNREHDYFPNLRAVLVYPDTFIVPVTEEDELGLVEEEVEHEGESWDAGTVVLSWKDIQRDLRALDGRNVILHEFAHQIWDAGDVHFESNDEYQRFAELIETEYERHVRSVERDRYTFLDPYGAGDPAEFFSVITEAFFEQPNRFEKRHPELFEALRTAYRQDPRDYV